MRNRKKKVNFQKALSLLLKFEGGESNHANDSGGMTNRGVTQATYNQWRRSKGLSYKSVDLITKSEIKSVYMNYWKCSGAYRYNNDYGYHLFDVAVMSSCSTAKKLDREAKGNLSYMVARRKTLFDRVVKHNPKNSVFYEGWLNRLYSIDDELLKLT